MKIQMIIAVLMLTLTLTCFATPGYAQLKKMSDAELAEVTGLGFVVDDSASLREAFMKLSAAQQSNLPASITQTSNSAQFQNNTKNPGITIWIDDVVIETSSYTTKFIDTDGFNDNQAAAIVIKHGPSKIEINALR